MEQTSPQAGTTKTNNMEKKKKKKFEIYSILLMKLYVTKKKCHNHGHPCGQQKLEIHFWILPGSNGWCYAPHGTLTKMNKSSHRLSTEVIMHKIYKEKNARVLKKQFKPTSDSRTGKNGFWAMGQLEEEISRIQSEGIHQMHERE